MGAAGERARAEFGGYFVEHHREVGMLAYRLCGDRAVAEEVTADAFAEAWRRWNELAREGVPGAEAMHGIVERLIQGRVRTAGRGQPPQQPRGDEEPDAVRVSALLSERITLIPPQDAPTEVIARIVEPVEPSAPEEPEGRPRRQIALSGMITAGAVVALGVIAIAVSTGGHSAPASHPPLSLAATGTIDAAVTGAASSAAPTSASPSSASPSPSPSHSASPSASPTPSASKSPTVATTSAAPSTTTAPPSTTSAALTAYASVNSGSNRSWTQLDVATTVAQTLSALTISITVADCPGLSATGAWNSGASGQFVETTTQNGDGSITYVFELTPGSEVTSGADISFAAQFSHYFHGWSAGADSYSVDAVVAGSNATDSFGGAF